LTFVAGHLRPGRATWSPDALLCAGGGAAGAGARLSTLPLSSLPCEALKIAPADDGRGTVSPRLRHRAEPAPVDVLIAKLLEGAALPAPGSPPDREPAADAEPGGPPRPPPPFALTLQELLDLCAAAEARFRAEESVLRLEAPMRIFGDLHGQFADLLQLFSAFGSPLQGAANGDLRTVDYLFLGDYVDRGPQSLEVLCLLLALKAKHPSSVHLLRGNHETREVNSAMGFLDECVDRLGPATGMVAWNRFNEVFDWLPLAATVGRRVFCVHGGPGKNVKAIADIAGLRRPLVAGCLNQADQDLLLDVLWSDPTAHDSVLGVHRNPARGPGIFNFGPDLVRGFCARNDVDVIVRGHECVQDGFERFANGHLVTVFSATNYKGTTGNNGCVLDVGRDLVLCPRVLLPPLAPDRQCPSPPTPRGARWAGFRGFGERSKRSRRELWPPAAGDAAGAPPG